LVDALIERLSEFHQKLRGVVLSPQGLLNGLSRLTYEIGESKANGGESQFSGYSLEDIRFNIAGIDAAYSTVFAQDLIQKNPELAASTRAEVERLKSIVAAADLKSIDQNELRKASENLATIWQMVGPMLGLDPPRLED